LAHDIRLKHSALLEQHPLCWLAGRRRHGPARALRQYSSMQAMVQDRTRENSLNRRVHGSHIIWGSIGTAELDRELGSSSSNGVMSSASRLLDGVEFRPESSSWSEHERSTSGAQQMLGAARASGDGDKGGGGSGGGTSQRDGDDGCRVAAVAPVAAAAGQEGEMSDDDRASLWANLSTDEQAGLVAILTQTAQAGTLPERLREFWSKGSKGHGQGLCRPCHYIHTSSGCKKGGSCKHCHLPHTTRAHRPSQTQRQHCKRFVSALSELSMLESEENRDLVQQIVRRSSYTRSLLREHVVSTNSQELMNRTDRAKALCVDGPPKLKVSL